MNVDVGIWSKLTKVVVGLIVAACLFGISFLFLPEIRKNERYRKEIMRIEAQIQKEDAVGKQMREQIESMRNPEVVARLAREKLGYARADETVIIFEPAPTNTYRR
jgi:cell division protein FtsB